MLRGDDTGWTFTDRVLAVAALLADGLSFVGNAPGQVASFCRSVDAVAAAHPRAAAYTPEPIL